MFKDLSENFQRFSEIFKDVQKLFKLRLFRDSKDFKGFSKIFQILFGDFQKFPEMFQRFSKMFRDFPNIVLDTMDSFRVGNFLLDRKMCPAIILL